MTTTKTCPRCGNEISGTDRFCLQCGCGRRIVRVEDFTDEEMALIARAEVPTECSYLDAELKDWEP